ncbi:Holliday junction ATP-dependent DNA helicase RuvA [Candidatus Tisiphia endosymbiont of Sialis lutaria]|uniref:Holliday junction ATP-dependent DNA helicase RuvA n=1 Tax=unclassified Candidatus Tisiphia TaxID=2996318 RepID=UPI00312C87E9
MKDICKKVKCIVYLLIYGVVTWIIAKIILISTFPDDGQCHCSETPALLHYILALIVTTAPVITYICTKNCKLKTKSDTKKL